LPLSARAGVCGAQAPYYDLCVSTDAVREGDIRRLKDRYLAGEISLEEFERGVALALSAPIVIRTAATGGTP
jgi:hypothetical protein